MTFYLTLHAYTSRVYIAECLSVCDVSQNQTTGTDRHFNFLFHFVQSPTFTGIPLTLKEEKYNTLKLFKFAYLQKRQSKQTVGCNISHTALSNSKTALFTSISLLQTNHSNCVTWEGCETMTSPIVKTMQRSITKASLNAGFYLER